MILVIQIAQKLAEGGLLSGLSVDEIHGVKVQLDHVVASHGPRFSRPRFPPGYLTGGRFVPHGSRLYIAQVHRAKLKYSDHWCVKSVEGDDSRGHQSDTLQAQVILVATESAPLVFSLCWALDIPQTKPEPLRNLTWKRVELDYFLLTQR